jgi:hypothetical protein
VPAEHLDQLADLLPGDRADRYHVGEVGQLADRHELRGQGRPGDEVDLGDHGDHLCPQRRDPGGDEPVSPTDLLVRRDAQADHVDLAPGLLDQVVEPLAEQGTGAVQAGRVHQDQLGVGPVQHCPDDVPGGLRPGRRDRDLLSDDRVDQGRLAGVGPADDTREPGPEVTHSGSAYR